MTDKPSAIQELFDLLTECGATPRLHGEPVTADQMQAAALSSVVARVSVADMVKASRDCPTCPECSAPCGSLCRDDGAEAPRPGWLRCVCCGHEWEATPAELDQAEAADRVWEELLQREAMSSDA